MNSSRDQSEKGLYTLKDPFHAREHLSALLSLHHRVSKISQCKHLCPVFPKAFHTPLLPPHCHTGRSLFIPCLLKASKWEVGAADSSRMEQTRLTSSTPLVSQFSNGYERTALGRPSLTLPRWHPPAQGAFPVGNAVALLGFQTPRFACLTIHTGECSYTDISNIWVL